MFSAPGFHIWIDPDPIFYTDADPDPDFTLLVQHVKINKI